MAIYIYEEKMNELQLGDKVIFKWRVYDDFFLGEIVKINKKTCVVKELYDNELGCRGTLRVLKTRVKLIE